VACAALGVVEILVGVGTTLCGGPFFMYLLKRERAPKGAKSGNRLPPAGGGCYVRQSEHADMCMSMTLRRISVLVLVLAMNGGAQGQNVAANCGGAESEEDRLTREVEDPTAILTQLKFEDLDW
jgi:hypothetical protein